MSSRPVCPQCGSELDEVYYARSVKLEWQDNKWIETDVFSDEVCCARCNAQLESGELDRLGRPLPN